MKSVKKPWISNDNMRIIKTLFFSLLAFVLIASTGVFILFQTFDSDPYLLKFTQKASDIIGRQVSVKHVGLGLSSRGVTLDAWPLTIADDPDFTSQPFVKIDRIRVSLDLQTLILQHKIQITNILLQSPWVHLIRSQEGNINVRNIAQKSMPVLPQAVSTGDNNGVTQINKGHSQVNIKSIIIQDGAISYIDQSQDLPQDVWLKGINADLNDFSLTDPVLLSFTASGLVFKSTSPQKQDNPVFKKVSGYVRFNRPNLQGDIIISDGVIKNFNIVKAVLSHAVKNFGGLDDMVNKLGANDTLIEKAEAKFSYHDKTIFMDDFLLQTNILEFNAQGSMGEGLNTTLQTMLRLNTDLSASLVNQLDGLKYLCDDSKRIAIGGSLNGVYPHLKYKSDKDFKKKTKKVFNAMFRQLLGA